MKRLQSPPTTGQNLQKHRKHQKQNTTPKRRRSKSPPIEPTGEFLSKRDICAKLHISQRTLEDWVEDGIFPPPHCFTKQTLRWESAQLQKFINEAKTQVVSA